VNMSEKRSNMMNLQKVVTPSRHPCGQGFSNHLLPRRKPAGSARSRHPGESRGPVLLLTSDVSGYRLSPV
jgi:hypothetical protein